MSVAEAHFEKYGFEMTDMRQIASEADIAVGTIYLHYQNKETLYMQVIKNRWGQFLSRAVNISRSEYSPEEQLLLVIKELAKEMTLRETSSLWKEIAALHHQMINRPSEAHQTNIREPIIRIIGSILREIAKTRQIELDEKKFYQLGSCVFIMTVDACMQEPENLTSSIELIFNLINSYFHQS